MIDTNNYFLWVVHNLDRLKVRKAVKGEKLETLNGTVYANDGDYVIICVNGEKYVRYLCKYDEVKVQTSLMEFAK